MAHLDSVASSPGADDNASGVAALIECARLLATLDETPSVTFAVVDLEEVGRLGSAALARDRTYTDGVEAVVCLESVGTFDDAPGSQRLGALSLVFPDMARRVRANERRGDFALALHRRSTAGAAGALARAGAALNPPLTVLTARDPRPDGRAGLLATGVFPPLATLDRSDHAPFWNKGVPSMMITTTAPFRNRHYHGAGDKPALVDHARVCAVAVAVAAQVATWPRATGTD
jgi:Zn-dependent M28 family amino/carboxypeptidase